MPLDDRGSHQSLADYLTEIRRQEAAHQEAELRCIRKRLVTSLCAAAVLVFLGVFWWLVWYVGRF